jgi:hypothetical protein
MLVEVHEDSFEVESDEVDAVLAGLADLLARVSSPVVRACLEEARDDILHLTGRGAAFAESEAVDE